MSTNKKAAAAAKPDLDSLYRPIGLKAVVAATLLLKRKPQTKPA